MLDEVDRGLLDAVALYLRAVIGRTSLLLDTPEGGVFVESLDAYLEKRKVEMRPALTDADALADLAGTARPDNPGVKS